MARLEGKNILFIIPKDYYDDGQLEPLRDKFIEEGAEVRVASSKFKEAVGMNTGRFMPDMMIVDAIEGITGDSYVMDGKGTRQVKGVFHGTVVVGGKGARKYLWKDKLVRLLILDRFKSGMVVGALGTGVPCLGEADLLTNLEVASAQDPKTLAELETSGAIPSDDSVSVHDRLVTAEGSEGVESFAEAFMEAVSQTAVK